MPGGEQLQTVRIARIQFQVIAGVANPFTIRGKTGVAQVFVRLRQVGRKQFGFLKFAFFIPGGVIELQVFPAGPIGFPFGGPGGSGSVRRKQHAPFPGYRCMVVRSGIKGERNRFDAGEERFQLRNPVAGSQHQPGFLVLRLHLEKGGKPFFRLFILSCTDEGFRVIVPVHGQGVRILHQGRVLRRRCGKPVVHPIAVSQPGRDPWPVRYPAGIIRLLQDLLIQFCGGRELMRLEEFVGALLQLGLRPQRDTKQEERHQGQASVLESVIHCSNRLACRLFLGGRRHGGAGIRGMTRPAHRSCHLPRRSVIYAMRPQASGIIGITRRIRAYGNGSYGTFPLCRANCIPKRCAGGPSCPSPFDSGFTALTIEPVPGRYSQTFGGRRRVPRQGSPTESANHFYHFFFPCPTPLFPTYGKRHGKFPIGFPGTGR